MVSTLTSCILLVFVAVRAFGAPIPVGTSVGAVHSVARIHEMRSIRVGCRVLDSVPESVCDLFKAREDLRLSALCRRSILTTAPEDYMCNIALQRGGVHGVYVTHNSKANVWYLTLEENIYSVEFEYIFDGFVSGFPYFNFTASLGKLDCID